MFGLFVWRFIATLTVALDNSALFRVYSTTPTTDDKFSTASFCFVWCGLRLTQLQETMPLSAVRTEQWVSLI